MASTFFLCVAVTFLFVIIFWMFNIHIFTSTVSAKCFPSSVLLHLQSLILILTLISRRQTYFAAAAPSKNRPPRSPPG